MALVEGEKNAHEQNEYTRIVIFLVQSLWSLPMQRMIFNNRTREDPENSISGEWTKMNSTLFIHKKLHTKYIVAFLSLDGLAFFCS